MEGACCSTWVWPSARLEGYEAGRAFMFLQGVYWGSKENVLTLVIDCLDGRAGEQLKFLGFCGVQWRFLHVRT